MDHAPGSSVARTHVELARRVGSARVVVVALMLVGAAALVALRGMRSGATPDSAAPSSGAHDGDRGAAESMHAARARSDAGSVGDVDEPAALAARRVEPAAADAPSSAPAVLGVKVLVFDAAGPGLTSAANVQVELAFATAGSELFADAIAAARTDDDGIARFEMSASQVAGLRARPGSPAVVARVHEAGWQSRFATRELPSTGGGLELSISTARGGTIVGRVVDAEGRGVDAASIDAASTGTPSADAAAITRLLLGSSATSRSRADGSFELHLRHPVPHDVHATAEHVGTSMLRALDVRFTDPPQAIDLRLVGPGRLRGRVRDRRGVATAGVQLRIEHALSEVESGLDGFDGFFQGPRDVRPVRSGSGLTSARVTTDAKGEFDVTGLCRERYRIGVAVGSPWARSRHWLTEVPVEADGLELDLVYERPHLVVRVVDASGQPLRSALQIATDFATDMEARIVSSETSRVGWPDQPSVRVSPVDAPGPQPEEPVEVHDPQRDALADVRGVAVDDGSFVFELEGDRSYDVCLEGGQLAFATRRVQVREGAGRIDVELVAEARATGRVLLEVRDVDGEPSTETVRVRLEDPRTGARALELDDGPAVRTPWPPGFAAPVGRWRLVVDGFPEEDRESQIRTGARGHVRHEQIVHVLANENTPVIARLPGGARLRITARGTVAPDPTDVVPDPEAGHLASGWVVTPSGRTARSLDPGAVRVRLIQVAREPIPVDFVAQLAPGSNTPSQSLALGETRISRLLPSGEFTLEARLSDGRVVRNPVVLSDGETVDATIEFPER